MSPSFADNPPSSPGLLARVVRYLKQPRIIFRSICPTCEHVVEFSAQHTWFRDHYLYPRCGSKPRKRALMRTLEMFFLDWRDNVFVERLWRSVKYEEAYRRAYDSVSAAQQGMERYFG